MKAKLTGWRELSPTTRHFDFEAADWDGAFTPGQFLSLTEGEITRAYSIASPPDGPRFGLCANLVPEGKYSPWLFGRMQDDEIEFKGPYGAFTPRAGAAESILVATGTGVAPFRSYLAGSALQGKCTLILGTRYESGLLYDEEWREMERTRPDFAYWPTLTRPSPEWRGLTGRVHAHAARALGERRDIDVYICGLHEMVNEARAQLKELGLDRKRIICEKYD